MSEQAKVGLVVLVALGIFVGTVFYMLNWVSAGNTTSTRPA